MTEFLELLGSETTSFEDGVESRLYCLPWWLFRHFFPIVLPMLYYYSDHLPISHRVLANPNQFCLGFTRPSCMM